MDSDRGRYGYRVVVTRKALRDLVGIPAGDQARMREAIADLANWPEHGRDVRKLKGRTPPTWRLKEGDWRALFTLDSNAREVEVGDVVRRSHAYDR